MSKRHTVLLKNILLPILGAIYPVIFLYSHNVKIITPSSLILPLIVVILLALILMGFFYLFQRNWLHAGLSATLFLIFFHTYGIVYAKLVDINRVQVDHYTLLPLVILLVLYGAFIITRLNAAFVSQLQTILILLVGGLVLFNLVPVISAETSRAQSRAAAKTMTVNGVTLENAPDIYFVIFDEYAGFDALHEYWKYDGWKEFVSFLEARNFYVAEHSHGVYADTLYEISSRLNLEIIKNQKAPIERNAADAQKLYDSIADNKVMRILKSYGYTTVVFDGARIPLKAKTEIIADYNFEYENTSLDIGADEFTVLFFEQTMIRAFPGIYKRSYEQSENERNLILYGLEKIKHLEEVPTPRFVYLHLLLPHVPFIFDENGGALDYDNRVNWSYYLGQHKYATKRAEQLVDDILENSDPDRPPVIILQSDHGARNDTYKSHHHVGLENYDDKYKTSILNAVFIPGYDYSTLTKDLSPVEPLTIVLNHYFHAGVEIEVKEK